MEWLSGEGHWESLCGTFCLGIEKSSVNKTFKRQGENISMEIIKREVIKGRSHVEGYQKPVHRKRLLVEFLSGPCVIWTSRPLFSDRVLMRGCQG